jgi:hypothetical protein
MTLEEILPFIRKGAKFRHKDMHPTAYFYRNIKSPNPSYRDHVMMCLSDGEKFVSEQPFYPNMWSDGWELVEE